MKKQEYNHSFLHLMVLLCTLASSSAYSSECMIARMYQGGNNAMLYRSRLPLPQEASTNEKHCAQECKRYAYYMPSNDARMIQHKKGAEKVEISCTYGTSSAGRIVARFHTTPETLTVRDNPSFATARKNEPRANSIVAPLNDTPLPQQPLQARTSTSSTSDNYEMHQEDYERQQEDYDDYHYDDGYDNYYTEDSNDGYDDIPNDKVEPENSSDGYKPPYQNIPAVFRPYSRR